MISTVDQNPKLDELKDQITDLEEERDDFKLDRDRLLLKNQVLEFHFNDCEKREAGSPTKLARKLENIIKELRLENQMYQKERDHFKEKTMILNKELEEYERPYLSMSNHKS